MSSYQYPSTTLLCTIKKELGSIKPTLVLVTCPLPSHAQGVPRGRRVPARKCGHPGDGHVLPEDLCGAGTTAAVSSVMPTAVPTDRLQVFLTGEVVRTHSRHSLVFTYIPGTRELYCTRTINSTLQYGAYHT